MVIHDNSVNVYGQGRISNRDASFKAGEASLEDKYRSGRPITEENQANIDLVESLIDINPRVSYSYLEEETFLSRGTLNRIIKDNLYLSKRTSRRVPYHLTIENKHRRLEFG